MMATIFWRGEFWGDSGMSSDFDSDIILTSDFRLYRITRSWAGKTLRGAGIRDYLRHRGLETQSTRSAHIPVPRASLPPWPRLLGGPIRGARFRLYRPAPCPLRTAVSPAPQSGERVWESG